MISRKFIFLPSVAVEFVLLVDRIILDFYGNGVSNYDNIDRVIMPADSSRIIVEVAPFLGGHGRKTFQEFRGTESPDAGPCAPAVFHRARLEVADRLLIPQTGIDEAGDDFPTLWDRIVCVDDSRHVVVFFAVKHFISPGLVW